MSLFKFFGYVRDFIIVSGFIFVIGLFLYQTVPEFSGKNDILNPNYNQDNPQSQYTQSEYPPLQIDIRKEFDDAGGVKARDARMLAMTIYGEARGEGYDGMVAVAHVVLNRTRANGANGWPKSIQGVIIHRNAFSVWNNVKNSDGEWVMPPEKIAMFNAFQNEDCRIEVDPLAKQACDIAYGVLQGKIESPFKDHTPTYYHAKRIHWEFSKKFVCIGDIGNHRFYVENGIEFSDA